MPEFDSENAAFIARGRMPAAIRLAQLDPLRLGVSLVPQASLKDQEFLASGMRVLLDPRARVKL